MLENVIVDVIDKYTWPTIPLGAKVQWLTSGEVYIIGYETNKNLEDKTLKNLFNLTSNNASFKLDLENKIITATANDWIDILPKSINVKHITNQIRIDYTSLVIKIEKLDLIN